MSAETQCGVCGAKLDVVVSRSGCPACLLRKGLFAPSGGPADRVATGACQAGRYELLEVLGEGGFGVVHRGLQRDPFRREVAVKVLKPGMDSREVVSRFNLEREALALMDHPGIARVYDAGTMDNGSPYFVLDLIDGTPLTTFCDAGHLNLEERLRLFIQICGAVQHAHHKGIIHRDLKPGNVLVSQPADGTPRAVVIDFGVAKAIGMPLTERTFHTLFGRMMGTPQYMSPEQAELHGVDVDTRSDVYSLGVILYELVTGTTPLDGKALVAAGFDGMRRMIREQEPPRPSARVLALPEGAGKSTALARGLEGPEHLARRLRGDLDWVIMRALDKDRSRRYDTCSALAEDVRRFLENMPVSAGPPGTGYRMAKFVRRNRGPVAAGALIMATVLAGAVVSFSLYLSQRHAEERAQRSRWNSLVDQARAYRMGGANTPSRRAKALRALAEAVAIPLGDEGREARENQVRDEMIACLAWVDASPLTLASGMERSRRAAAIEPGHRWCVVAPADGGVEVLALPGANPLATLATGKLAKAVFSGDGEWVLLAEEDGQGWKLMGWEWRSGALTSLGSCRRGACDLKPDGNGIVAATEAGTLEIRRRTGNLARPALELPGPANAVRIDGTGRFVAVSLATPADAAASRLLVLELDDGRVAHNLKAEPATALAWGPDGRQIALGNPAGGLILASLPETPGESEATLLRLTQGHHEDAVESLAWSHDGRMLASGGADGKVYLWDARQGFALSRNQGWSGSLSFSADDSTAGPLVWEGTLRELRIDQSYVCRRAQGHPGERRLEAGAWNGSGTLLATAAPDGVRLWNRHGDKLAVLQDVEMPAGLVFTPLDPSTDILFVAGRNGIVRREIALERTGTEVRGTLRPPVAVGPAARCGALALAGGPAAPVLIAATGEGLVVMPLSGGATRTIPARGWPDSVSASPDGKFVAASLHGSAEAAIWSVTDGSEQKRLPLIGPARVAFSHDGRWLMTGDSQAYRLWHVGTWTEDRSLRIENQMGTQAGRMVFSPRETVVLISQNVQDLVVLRSDTLQLLTQPSFDQQWPLCISGDGLIMATEAPGGRVCLWDLAAIRTELQALKLDWDLDELPPIHIPAVTSLRQSPP